MEDQDDFNNGMILWRTYLTPNIPMISLLPGKKYPALSVFANIEAHDVTKLSSAPWFDVEALAVDGFVDQ